MFPNLSNPLLDTQWNTLDTHPCAKNKFLESEWLSQTVGENIVPVIVYIRSLKYGS